MSVDIAWDSITGGPDGEVLAESIRAFIHVKFQQITLPRFIKSVHVHSFEFGSVCPEIEIKDICDPLPDFYEDEEDDELDTAGPSNNERDTSAAQDNSTTSETHAGNLFGRVGPLQNEQRRTNSLGESVSDDGSSRTYPHEALRSTAETTFGAFARSGTPGIPGGTSNMGYFHLPMTGLPGTQTPLEIGRASCRERV